eukprot:537601-Rhodomonas_salina.1
MTGRSIIAAQSCSTLHLQIDTPMTEIRTARVGKLIQVQVVSWKDAVEMHFQSGEIRGDEDKTPALVRSITVNGS